MRQLWLISYTKAQKLKKKHTTNCTGVDYSVKMQLYIQDTTQISNCSRHEIMTIHSFLELGRIMNTFMCMMMA